MSCYYAEVSFFKFTVPILWLTVFCGTVPHSVLMVIWH